MIMELFCLLARTSHTRLNCTPPYALLDTKYILHQKEKDIIVFHPRFFSMKQKILIVEKVYDHNFLLICITYLPSVQDFSGQYRDFNPCPA